MNAKAPPVPDANRSHKGPGDDATPPASNGGDRIHADARGANLSEQDRQGNIKQNTTHQGHQQDR